MEAPGPRARIGATAGRAVVFVTAAAGIGLLEATVLPARIVLHQCVSTGGTLGLLGLRLDLLRSAADCPDGAFAFTPLARGGVVVLLSIALPVLLAHLALGAGGLGLTTALLRTVRSTVGVLAAVLPRVPHASAIVSWPAPPLPAPLGAMLRCTTADVFAAHPRRGPPVLPA